MQRSTLWNETDAKIGSLSVERWFNWPVWSVWFIFEKGPLTEGTLSLFITVASGFMLGLFFFGFADIWHPMYAADQIEEEEEWLSVSNGMGLGNTVYATFYSGFIAFKGRLKFFNCFFPILFWLLVSVLSAGSQISIHGVKANQVNIVPVKLKALNFTAIINDGLHQIIEYDTSGFAATMTTGMALIHGRTVNISTLAFILDDKLCSGQLLPHATFETNCFVDKTKCQSATYQWNTSDPQYPFPIYLPFEDPDYYETMYKHDRRLFIPFTNLFVDDSDPFFQVYNYESDDHLYSGRMNLTNLNITYDYTGGFSLENIMKWTVSGSGSLTPMPDNTTIYKYPFRIFRGPAPLDFWRGRCYHRIDMCKTRISKSKAISISDCSPADLYIREWGRSISPESVVGIGDFWRADSSVAVIMARVAFETGINDPEQLISMALGRMGLAWSMSFIQLEYVVDDIAYIKNTSQELLERYVMPWDVDSVSIDPRDAIAIDVAMVLLLVAILFISIVVFLVGVWWEVLGPNDTLLSRRRKWDPLIRYAELMDNYDPWDEKDMQDIATK
ncbi:hypothetical protein HDU67_002269 [Dinochytrium kinnereticum]|nr:hypothetical protein HDU67_002269 [Dinochytrium kinnereticum]